MEVEVAGIEVEAACGAGGGGGGGIVAAAGATVAGFGTAAFMWHNSSVHSRARNRWNTPGVSTRYLCGVDQGRGVV